MPRDVRRVVAPGDEVGLVEDMSVEREARRQPGDDRLAHRASRARERLRPIDAMRDDLHEQRVVIARHHKSVEETGIDAKAGSGGLAQQRDAPGRGHEAAPRVLRGHAHFDRRAAATHVALRERQRLARGDAQL